MKGMRIIEKLHSYLGASVFNYYIEKGIIPVSHLFGSLNVATIRLSLYEEVKDI